MKFGNPGTNLIEFIRLPNFCEVGQIGAVKEQGREMFLVFTGFFFNFEEIAELGKYGEKPEIRRSVC